ncbi:PrsW family intramembrane metalloprotease [Mycolicibacterium sp. S2-37]|uniref:PrsW family intramembrane metalloprotease n=1 Tax=Mycolicibacterium sp. S2-37 TaxID=2810297 RepID=UPI001A9445B7|nr:PrsW family intramembrane metalloprotease [Mycolicibacterium sp. S2-37]MBO0679186.1 PrsW family intramembrane metalloprotease [Mycolicibacterium sp. S2-37]
MTAVILDDPSVPARRPVVYRPESAVFWVFLAALAVGICGIMSVWGGAIAETIDGQLELAPLWLALVAFLLWVIFRFDPYRSVRRYPQLLLAGAALGATAAPFIAIHTSSGLDKVFDRFVSPDTMAVWGPALHAPVSEEASKAACAAVILVLGASVLTRISHALLLGMFVGLGFDLAEDLSYAATAAIDSLDSDGSGIGNTLFVRGLTAVPAHWSYTALATVGVLLLLPSFSGRHTWSTPKRIGLSLALFFLAWLMHFLFDAPNLLPLGVVGKIVVDLAIFLAACVLLIGDERRWVRDRIAAGRGTEPLASIDGAVLDSLCGWRNRRRFRRVARRQGGRADKKAARKRQCAALDLIQAT